MAIKKTNEEKILFLQEEKIKISDRLNSLYRNFRGVIHEDASSEMKYTTIKVLEAHLKSIDDELVSLGVSNEKN